MEQQRTVVQRSLTIEQATRIAELDPEFGAPISGDHMEFRY